MVGSMYQAETPSGLCKYKDCEKGRFHICWYIKIKNGFGRIIQYCTTTKETFQELL